MNSASSSSDSYRNLPSDYTPLLSAKDTQMAIWKLRSCFERELCQSLNIFRVESPLIMLPDTGMTETVDRQSPRRPISFTIRNDGAPFTAEVTQAATKWKRWALKQFECSEGEGILTDMRAVRQDESPDSYHSAYVDQWDWEKVIREDQRTLQYLESTVAAIWGAIRASAEYITAEYPILAADGFVIPESIPLVHSEDLYDQYPDLSPDDRETELVKQHKAVFLCGVGYNLPNGVPHGTRTADYDDWITPTTSAKGRAARGLNGDILVWNPTTRQRHELSSMAVRVTKQSLAEQLAYIGDVTTLDTTYGRMICNDEIPLSIGGGIGQSRLFMYLLRKAALGECSVAPWPVSFKAACRKRHIPLLE